MKVKARNFPHPVLNPVTDDFQNGYFKGEITEQTQENESLEFNIHIDLQNPGLQNLIEKKKASFNVHFECIPTMQRFTFSKFQTDFKVSIEKELLNKKVDVNFFILADENFEDYTNADAHPDYAGVNFKIQKGDILAFGESQTIYIEKQPISKTNSIFKVSKATSSDAPSISIDLCGNQLEITVPEISYEKVGRLQAYGDDCNKILISMLYLPALIDTLFNIQDLAKTEDYDLEELSNLDWYRTLDKKLKNMGYNIAELHPYEITSIAYDLLNSSPEAPLISLENIIYNSEEDEE